MDLFTFSYWNRLYPKRSLRLVNVVLKAKGVAVLKYGHQNGVKLAGPGVDDEAAQ